MPKPKQPTKASAAKRPAKKPESSRRVDLTVENMRREVRELLGPNATYEQRRDASFEFMREVLWKDADDDLRESVTDAREVAVGDKKFRRMKQESSATYYGRWGTHHIKEALYREVGVRNGPTIKPVELRAGIVEHMTPDMARIVGELSAERGSRALERTLRAVGHNAPSRAFLADLVTRMGTEIADGAAALERGARESEALSSEVASVSCGLDRMAVRMSEPAAATNAARASTRSEPYERTPPPPKDQHYRMAWVGSTSIYDAEGKELHTWRSAMEADADPAQLADRVAADVAWISSAHPDAPVHCVQDGAPELRALPEALARVLPEYTKPIEVVDFEHLMGYLDDVVDECAPNDPHRMKDWYRNELLRDDDAIDRIQRNLKEQAKRIPDGREAARAAVAAALSYIGKRKDKMRYASFYDNNLPIGSGATESTCWQMQQRVKLPGQQWEQGGLRGVLAIRGLVLSDRWNSAWTHYAAHHRADVSAGS